MTRVIGVSLGIACAGTVSAETLLEREFQRQQAALESGWVFAIAHDGGCGVMATARSKDGKTAGLSVGWSADGGFDLMLTTGLFSQLAMPTIEVVGTTRAYAFSKSPLPKITGQDALELKQDISAGRALRLSGRFDFPVGSGAMAIAALDACAEMFAAHPVLPTPEFGNVHMVHSHNLEAGCSVSGFWPEAGGFWVVVDVARDGATVRLHRLPVNSGSDSSGTVDLRGFGGPVMKFVDEVEMPFASDRVAPLEATFLAGETKPIRIEFPGKPAQILEFGGPRARAPTAMFAVCRAMLPGAQAAT